MNYPSSDFPLSFSPLPNAEHEKILTNFLRMELGLDVEPRHYILIMLREMYYTKGGMDWFYKYADHLRRLPDIIDDVPRVKVPIDKIDRLTEQNFKNQQNQCRQRYERNQKNWCGRNYMLPIKEAVQGEDLCICGLEKYRHGVDHGLSVDVNKTIELIRNRSENS